MAAHLLGILHNRKLHSNLFNHANLLYEHHENMATISEEVVNCQLLLENIFPQEVLERLKQRDDGIRPCRKRPLGLVQWLGSAASSGYATGLWAALRTQEEVPSRSDRHAGQGGQPSAHAKARGLALCVPGATVATPHLRLSPRVIPMGSSWGRFPLLRAHSTSCRASWRAKIEPAPAHPPIDPSIHPPIDPSNRPSTRPYIRPSF